MMKSRTCFYARLAENEAFFTSTVFFSLYMNDLVNKLKKTCGKCTVIFELYSLMFADDVTEALFCKLIAISNFRKENGINLNPVKSIKVVF